MNPNKPDADKAAEEKQTPEQMVEENFKGLNELIRDSDITHFYKSLIIECIKEYHFQQSSQSGKERAALEKIANLPDAISESAAFDVARNIARQALYGN